MPWYGQGYGDLALLKMLSYGHMYITTAREVILTASGGKEVVYEIKKTGSKHPTLKTGWSVGRINLGKLDNQTNGAHGL